VYRSRGCVACHTVDGISAGVLGPNLNHFGNRSTVAGGILDNTTENLTAWLRDPPGVKPGSLMQNFQLTEDEITVLVAYLQSLR
jgi:cytochrome c oxidase subunit 2